MCIRDRCEGCEEYERRLDGELTRVNDNICNRKAREIRTASATAVHINNDVQAAERIKTTYKVDTRRPAEGSRATYLPRMTWQILAMQLE